MKTKMNLNNMTRKNGWAHYKIKIYRDNKLTDNCQEENIYTGY